MIRGDDYATQNLWQAGAGGLNDAGPDHGYRDPGPGAKEQSRLGLLHHRGLDHDHRG